MNTHEYAWNMERFLKGADIAQNARPRVPRFTAEQEDDLIRGYAAASVLLAYLLKGVANDTDDLPSDGT